MLKPRSIFETNILPSLAEASRFVSGHAFRHAVTIVLIQRRPSGAALAFVGPLTSNSAHPENPLEQETPTAKRLHVKARHGSAGRQKRGTKKSRRDGTPSTT
jgi:hypothetical protein